MNQKLSKFEKAFLIVVILVGILLRSYKIDTDLLFHRDQGLHSLSIWNIWHEGKISLLGHPSDVDGLTHAPIYYWLMTPAYALSGGDPVIASLFQIMLEMLSLPFFYLAVKRFLSRRTAIYTLIFYVCSYGLISYSRWLVNVTPILPFSHLFLFLLSRYLDRQSNKLFFLLSLVAGIIAQLNAAVGVFFLPFLLYLLARRFSLSRFLLLFSGYLLPALPLLAFELRHDFVLVRALLNFSQDSSQGLGISLSGLIRNLDIFQLEIAKVIIHPYAAVSLALIIFSIFQLRHHPHRSLFATFYLSFLLGLTLFRRGAISFFFISLLPLSLALIIHALSQLPTRFFNLVFIFLLLFNLRFLILVYRPTNALIPIGNANLITIQDRKNIIDWVYQQADGQPFSLWTYTLPYYQEEVWLYTLLWYAQPRYGYLPEKTTGFSPRDLQQSKHFFAIWEPDLDQPNRLERWQQEVILNFGPAVSTFSSHDLFATHHPLVE